MAEKQRKGIIRIHGSDIKGETKLFIALKKIKGINDSFSNAVCKICNLPFDKRVGDLSDKELKKIEDILKDPKKYKIPDWMLNRKNDPETGENIHIVGPNLDFVKKQDIEAQIKIRSYRGVRHMYGLPVRGQRTRGSFRKGRAVGVKRKKLEPATKKKGK